MPNITITPEQAAALARGENVTLEPERPQRRDLHNVVLFCGKQIYFIWDGHIEGDKLYTTRAQRIANTFGEPVKEPVSAQDTFLAEKKGYRTWKIVQVGA